MFNRVRQRIKKKATNGSDGKPTIPAVTYANGKEYIEEKPPRDKHEDVYEEMQKSADAGPVYESA